MDPQRTALMLRALNGDPALLQLWFHQEVLDRYRVQSGWKVIRSNNAGRVRSPGGWSLDFGIAEDDTLIHAGWSDLTQRLPATERQHWAQHAVTPPSSVIFLLMRMGSAACIDDGEIRDWPSPSSRATESESIPST